MDTIKLQSGIKRIAITDDDDHELGVIQLNPTDVLWLDRFYTSLSAFQTQQDELERRYNALDSVTETDDNGAPVNLQDRVSLMKQACEDAFAEIDELFGAGTSAWAFRGIYDYAMIGQFLGGFIPYLESVRSEKVAQYAKPKKANGKRQVMKS